MVEIKHAQLGDKRIENLRWKTPSKEVIKLRFRRDGKKLECALQHFVTDEVTINL
jgi:hypothetical protein